MNNRRRIPDGGGPRTRQGEVMSERGHLINVAYRFLGSLTEAEDAVQETYARWYALSDDQRLGISSPVAWLTTVVSRVCLDVLGSARVRRERYVGEWLPEPVPGESESLAAGLGAVADPADRVTLDESIDMAFLVVLDSMTPAERVSFLLHDVFRYPFAEIADIVGRTPAACRQLASSARRRVQAARPEPAPSPQRAEIVRRFRRAWRDKDLDALVLLLDPAATVVVDGGGLASAALQPIEGNEQIARYLVDLSERVPDIDLRERYVGGQPGLVALDGGATVTVFAFDVADHRIRRVWAVRNPEKLRAWNEPQ